MKFFKQSISQDPDRVSLPYDRIARLLVQISGDFSNPNLSQLLLASIHNDPVATVSVEMFVHLLTIQPQILKSNYLGVYSILSAVSGPARKDLERAQTLVQESLKDALGLSERAAMHLYIDQGVQQEIGELTEINVLLQGITNPGKRSIISSRE